MEGVFRCHFSPVSVMPHTRQLIVCSATLHSPEVKQLADEIMHVPTWVDLKVGPCATHHTSQHTVRSSLTASRDRMPCPRPCTTLCV